MKLIPVVMHENSHHVISRLRWDTAFDDKEQAVQLQERLSDWSGFRMQQEMSIVFDKLCPPEQTWRIPLLELNLGTIEFNNLELELPAKLRQQLHEKLTELILYSHQRGRQIEILDVKKSHVQLIRHFLWHGLLPWNYQAADGSVNQILTAQLQNNREELIAMLKESGFSAEQVRQRMAWQFNESNMIKIIEGFEPNVSGQIILFSNELTKIQQKETVVQAASTADFKKNLWLWVLNYLFTERGTVFNRIQFMKSSLVQMAAHYNMQYDQLFELIELSVAKLSRSLSLQPDFITTLKLLSKENKSHKKKAGNIVEETKDYWLSLEVLFRDQNLRRSAGKSAAFNDLVDALSKQNKERFLELVNSFGNTSQFWLPLINDLSDDTLKTMFSSIKVDQAAILTESILFLEQLLGGLKIDLDRNLLWYKGLMFLLDHTSTSFDEGEFIHLLITSIAQKKQQSKISILDQLMIAEVPSSLKTLLHAGIHQKITVAFMTEVSRMPALLFKKHLQKLMEMFHLQVSSGTKDQKRFETLKNILENYVRLYPKAVTEAFVTTPYQSSLEPILPSYITGKAIARLGLPVPNNLPHLKKIPGVALHQLHETKGSLPNSIIHHPEQLLEYVKKEIITESQLIWLNKVVSFNELLKIIGKLNESRQPQLDVLRQICQVLGTISLTGVSAREMQFVLFKKVVKAWTSGNWKLISAENIWNELIWEVCTKKAVPKTEFLSRMDHEKMRFPPALRSSLELLLNQDRLSRKPDKGSDLKILPSKPLTPAIQEKVDRLKGSVSVRNAGLVLINGYLSILLTRLDLISEQKKFFSTETRLAAVHYLQYVVTGLDNTEESLLPLNKLLCGIPLSQPVMQSVEISEAHKALIDGLIEAIISHWPSIGNCSVYGFRGNWLVRNGLLTENDDRWELTVEKRAYDLLINKSPFSFSVIRYPWMDKPLHVNWSY
jgi:hypothetical protein